MTRIQGRLYALYYLPTFVIFFRRIGYLDSELLITIGQIDTTVGKCLQSVSKIMNIIVSFSKILILNSCCLHPRCLLTLLFLISLSPILLSSLAAFFHYPLSLPSPLAAFILSYFNLQNILSSFSSNDLGTRVFLEAARVKAARVKGESGEGEGGEVGGSEEI